MTNSYTANGQLATVKDARNNLTTYEYDGFDRLLKTRYPHPSTANTSSTTDYQQLTYNAGSQVTSIRLRDGNSIGMTFDDAGRVTNKNLPGSDPDVTLNYDLLGRPKTVSNGVSLTYTFDQLGRMTRQASPQGNTDYAYDIAGRRTRLTYTGGLYVDYDYFVTGDVHKIRENGASSGAGVLATFAYDDLGRRTSLTRGNGTSTAYNYDDASRLYTLADDLASTAADVTTTLTYIPSGQLATRARDNDSYSWSQAVNVNRNYTQNGLNQYSAAGAITPTYDTKGNLTSAGTPTYTFDSENKLVGATLPSATLSYDPMDRLYQTVVSGVTTRLGYDGDDLISEYDGSNTLLRRYVHGPGVDEPLVWYEGSGTSDRRWLHADERGSVTAISNGAGASIAINSYDEYGIPHSNNQGRFQYTGQTWLAGLGMYHYKARTYSATLGRFLQPDPIGYGDGMNIYAYVGGDPVNLRDPGGLQAEGETNPIEVCGGVRINGECMSTSGALAWLDALNNRASHYCSPFGGYPGGWVGSCIPWDQYVPEPAATASPGGAGPQSNCSNNIGSARGILEGVALAADVATVGFVAGGITAPIALATKLLGTIAEGAIGAVNVYDGYANGDWSHLQAQGAGLVGRVIPGGRALQTGLKAARGPTGVLRNGAGKFRSSRLNNPGIKEAGDLATQTATDGAAQVVSCGVR